MPSTVMPGFDPWLSGSWRVPVEQELARVERWRFSALAQTGHVFSVHQIGAHESNEFEKAVFDLAYLLQDVQEDEGNQGDRDLNVARLHWAAAAWLAAL